LKAQLFNYARLGAEIIVEDKTGDANHFYLQPLSVTALKRGTEHSSIVNISSECLIIVIQKNKKFESA